MTAAGRRVGPYVLGPELGRGANGIVYEATDERLGRKVALKVLAEDVAPTADQRARFAREARLWAAVRHPNVAVVYGVVEEGERVWLALEHLAGETLAAALERGPLSIEDALEVARQIADGLEAAHEQGVVHRDLKPANVEREPDGTVKVLDFGLAKPVREATEDSPALTSEGLAVGTPLYMSPEQVRGRAVDRRADVWAFGCVLWELLTGRSAFDGPTTADVVHAILERDPDLERLPARTPVRVRELLARCFRKDPRRRLRDLGDARLELETALAERAWTASGARAAAEAGARRHGAPWPAVAALLAVVAAGAWLFGRSGPAPGGAPSRVLRLALHVPAGDRRTRPQLSPDGRTLVHEVGQDGALDDRTLVARRLDAFEDLPIRGTELVEAYGFAPDGERLAVVRTSAGSDSQQELVVVRLDGAEPPRFVATLPASLSETGSIPWLEDGRVVLSKRPRSLLLFDVDGSGGTEEVAIRCDESLWPHAPDVLDALPGGRVLASSFQIGRRGAFDCIVAIDVASGEQTMLVEDSRYAYWQPSGHLLFSRGDVLFGAPFDPGALRLTGAAVPLASDLRAFAAWMSGVFHASREGTVAWWPGGVRGVARRISWVEEGAEPRPWSDDALPLEGFLEVDETGAFLTAVVPGASGAYELWGSEIASPRLRRLLADPDHDYGGGAVRFDRRELVYCRYGAEGSELRRTSLDAPGEGQLLWRDDAEGVAFWSPRWIGGGRTLTFYVTSPDRKQVGVIDGTADGPAEPRIVFDGPRSVRHAELSPDGRWLLVTQRSGPPVVHRVEDGGLGPPVEVPAEGLGAPGGWWVPGSRDPYRIHLMPRDDRSVHEVELRETESGIAFSVPRPVLRVEGTTFFDAAPVAGDRYLAILTEPGELLHDRVHLMIGGLAPLGVR